MTPMDVKSCSVWELAAAVDGYVAAHVPDDVGAMSASEEDMLWAAVEARMGRVN